MPEAIQICRSKSCKYPLLTISDELSLGPHFNDKESSCIDLNEYDCDEHINEINHPGLVRNVEFDSD